MSAALKRCGVPSPMRALVGLFLLPVSSLLRESVPHGAGTHVVP
jgi:hypothetical protein